MLLNSIGRLSDVLREVAASGRSSAPNFVVNSQHPHLVFRQSDYSHEFFRCFGAMEICDTGLQS